MMWAVQFFGGLLVWLVIIGLLWSWIQSDTPEVDY